MEKLRILSNAGFAPVTVLATFGLIASAPQPPLAFGPPRIAFASNRDGNWEIYVTDLDGVHDTRLTRRDEQDRFALWSPDGSRIAFGSQVGGDHWELWVMDADGTHPRRLAMSIVAKGHRQWSHDGKSIVFGAMVGGDEEIFAVDVASGRIARLTTSRGEDSDPTWSPDDHRIAFSSTRDGNQEIYVMRADGAQPSRITKDPGADRSPAWAPDGSRIAFVSNRASDGDLWLASLADGSQQRLTIGAHTSNDGARWSPDGAYIALQTTDNSYDIKLVRMSDQELSTVAGSSAYDGQFSWSPTGNRLVFISDRDGFDAVYVTDVHGKQRRLTNTASLNPTWSP